MTTWRDRYVNLMDAVAGRDDDAEAMPTDVILAAMTAAAEIREGITAGLLDAPDPNSEERGAGPWSVEVRTPTDRVQIPGTYTLRGAAHQVKHLTVSGWVEEIVISRPRDDS